MIVLDSSAVLAYLLVEPGHDRVSEHLPDGLLSAVNFAEVVARSIRNGIAHEAAATRIEDTGIGIASVDAQQGLVLGTLIGRGRPLEIGLGDCCCIALAIVRGLPVLTGDRRWAELNLPIEVRLFR